VSAFFPELVQSLIQMSQEQHKPLCWSSQSFVSVHLHAKMGQGSFYQGSKVLRVKCSITCKDKDKCWRTVQRRRVNFKNLLQIRRWKYCTKDAVTVKSQFLLRGQTKINKIWMERHGINSEDRICRWKSLGRQWVGVMDNIQSKRSN